jgi:hypothetical protein
MKRHIWLLLALAACGCNALHTPGRSDQWECVQTSCDSPDEAVWPGTASPAAETAVPTDTRTASEAEPTK